MEEKKPPAGKQVGEIVHYFGNIGVGIVELSGELKVGDTIRIVGGEREFEQEIESMEIDHEKIQKASKGDDVGLKVKEKVREGDKLYKIE